MFFNSKEVWDVETEIQNFILAFLVNKDISFIPCSIVKNKYNVNSELEQIVPKNKHPIAKSKSILIMVIKK